MNIANQIKMFHTQGDENNIQNYDDFVNECEKKAIDIEQDLDAESTLYEFADGSVLVWCNNNTWTYGAR